MGQAYDDYLESLSSLRLTERDETAHWQDLVDIGADNMLAAFLFENTFGG